MLLVSVFGGGMLYHQHLTSENRPLPRWVRCEDCGGFTCTDKDAVSDPMSSQPTVQSVLVGEPDFMDNHAEGRAAVIGGVAVAFPLIVRAN